MGYTRQREATPPHYCHHRSSSSFQIILFSSPSPTSILNKAHPPMIFPLLDQNCSPQKPSVFLKTAGIHEEASRDGLEGLTLGLSTSLLRKPLSPHRRNQSLQPISQVSTTICFSAPHMGKPIQLPTLGKSVPNPTEVGGCPHVQTQWGLILQLPTFVAVPRTRHQAEDFPCVLVGFCQLARR